MVEIHYPVCPHRKRQTSAKQVAGSIWAYSTISQTLPISEHTRRGCPHLRKHVEHVRMPDAQLWYLRSSQTWRLHNSGFGCHTKLFTWDSRSFLMSIGQGGATSSSVRSGDQGWFGQFGAVSITEAPSSLIVHNTSGNILIGGNAYSLAAGQCDVCTFPFSGEWDGGRRTVGNAHSRSWWTYPPPLSRTGPNHPTRGATSTLLEESLFLERVSALQFRRLGTCAALMERKWQLRACTEVLTIATKSVCPRTLLPGLESMHPSWPRHVTYLCIMACGPPTGRGASSRVSLQFSPHICTWQNATLRRGAACLVGFSMRHLRWHEKP